MWFRARSYGWGWTPVTLEGWIVVGLFVVAVTTVVFYFLYRVRMGLEVRRAVLRSAISILVLIALLIAIACITGEPPKWRWGA